MSAALSPREQVLKLIAEHLCAEPERVIDDAVLTDDLGADSLDAIELAMAIEDELGITIADDEWRNDFRVTDVISLVDRKLAERAS